MQKKYTIALLVALALTGCGKNPTATSAPERVVSIKPATSKATTPTTAAKAPTTAAAKTSTSAAAPIAKTGTTTSPATTATTPATSTTTAAAADPNAPGSLALNVKVSGTATVASLALHIFDPAAPDQALDTPLALAAGAAAWNEAEVGAGTYTMQVKALAADGSVLGTGSTNATVKAGEPTTINLDLKVNTADAAPTTGGGTQVSTQSTGASPSPTPTPTPKPTATPTPAPTATPTPAPTPAQAGGTLGLTIDIL